MKNKSALTKILAIAGTVLVWLPLLAPVVFGLAALIERGRFLFDFLMPAELFPSALLGGGMLLWAALRARSRWKLIAWGLGAAVVIPVGGQVIASLSGLASGEREPEGFWWALVLASLASYCLALACVGVGGILLLRDLFRSGQE